AAALSGGGVLQRHHRTAKTAIMNRRNRVAVQRGNKALNHALLARHGKAGRMNEALTLARKTLAAAPETGLAPRPCPEAARAKGKFEEARSYCELLTKRWPENVWAATSLGVCMAQMQEPAVALEQLLRVESMTPSDPSVCGHLSSLYFRLHDYDKSLHYA